jgi:diguanylate cyclase (GGDEF)-like protein
MLARSWTLPVEPALIGVGFIVALGFLAAGWLLGRRVDKLTDEARRDPVTRVGNRRHWDECLAHELASARDARMPLSLLMVDVDNLKKLNDRGGHVVGDQALALVGDVLNDTCRSRDVAARFGGDEFALLLPRTRASEARVVAERLRTALAQRRSDSDSAALKDYLTVSIGIADIDSIESSTVEGHQPSAFALFDAADRALYAAKESGRDRVVVYERSPASSSVPPPPPPPPPRQSVVIDLEERRRAKKRESRSG